MSPRRQLALVVVGCAAAAVLALVATGRPWQVELAVRPAPLSDLRIERTGGQLRPWLPALAWVGLAGAGALLATAATARRVVGGLLVLAGAGLAAGGLTAAGGAEPSPAWPVLAGLAGLLLAGAGVAAVVASRRWPALGARYQRPRPPRPESTAARRPEALWEALDRGEDPTAR